MVEHGKHRTLVKAAIFLAAVVWGAAAAAQDGCRLALALAIDVSSSVDETEYALQKNGLASALDASEVRDAILYGGQGYVALAVYEWSGFGQQVLQLDWVILQSHGDIDRAAVAISQMERSHDDFPTSIGPALGFGAQLLARSPFCERKVIDVSGDGVNNDRYGPREAYRHFNLAGVTVNGLVVLGDEPDVAEYYLTEVLHGAQAFMITAAGYEDFRAAMTRKLYREVSNLVVSRASLGTQADDG
ncbi:MAG: DUF1194 domain-containing protein [Pseudomonadota bacterium]